MLHAPAFPSGEVESAEELPVGTLEPGSLPWSPSPPTEQLGHLAEVS